MQLAKQQHHAPEVEEAEEVVGLDVPAGREPPPSLEPGKEPFDLPAPLVAPQRSAILLAIALSTAAAFRRDELDAALVGESAAESAAVPRFVGDQSRRQLSYESSVESSLREHTVESVSSVNIDSDRKTMAVCNCHDLCRIAGAAFPDAGPPFFAGT